MEPIIVTCCCHNSCCLSYVRVSGEFFIFQQDSASAHEVCEMINLLECETLAFISLDLWPPPKNNPDLYLAYYKIWGIMQQRVYQT